MATEKVAPLHPGTFVLQVVQLGLVLAVARLFLIEQTYGFDRLIPIIFAGFIVHAWLPARWRGWFFVLLFPVCSIALLGLIPGVTLMTLGVALFLLCHLPISISGACGNSRRGWNWPGRNTSRSNRNDLAEDSDVLSNSDAANSQRNLHVPQRRVPLRSSA